MPAQLLLEKDGVGSSCEHLADLTVRLKFKDPVSVDDWYKWDSESKPNRHLPPLDVHWFESHGRQIRGCALGLRDDSTKSADGCVWMFALVSAEDSREFVERLVEHNNREWLWTCYAGSYDRILNECDYYTETVNRHANHLLNELPTGGMKHILDVGAGTGNIAISVLLKSPETKVTCIDASDAMLRMLRRKVSAFRLGNRCSVRQMDAAELNELNQTFDAVTISMVLFSVPSPLRVFREIMTLVRPGGQLIVTEPKMDLDVSVVVNGAERQLVERGRLPDLERDWKNRKGVRRRIGQKNAT